MPKNKTIIILGAWLWLFGCANTSGAQVSKQVDAFDKTVTHSVKNMPVGQFEFQAYIANGPKGGPFFYFLFMASAPSWQYLKCHSLELLADEAPVNPTKVTYDGSVGRGSVIESIMGFMTEETFTQITKSTVVKGRICSEVFEFSAQQIGNLKALGTEAGILKKSPTIQ